MPLISPLMPVPHMEKQAGEEKAEGNNSNSSNNVI